MGGQALVLDVKGTWLDGRFQQVGRQFGELESSPDSGVAIRVYINIVRFDELPDGLDLQVESV